VDAACRDVEAVFHTAAVPGVWGPWELFYETNTLGTENVIAACRNRGVVRLIHTSSPSVVYDGRPHEGATESLPYPSRFSCHYPHSKALAEQAVLAANGQNGLATVALRPHLIWGPRDNHLLPRLIHRATTGKLRRVGDGQNRISMSYVENAALAHLQVCDRLTIASPCAGKAYFVNEQEPVYLWYWVNELLERAQLPPVRHSIPYALAWTAGALLEGASWLGRRDEEPRMTRFLASQLATSHWYRTDAAQRDFGFHCEVSFDEAMNRTTPDLKRWAAT
jgi:nucleoside-diphosphate-sugar epimerase